MSFFSIISVIPLWTFWSQSTVVIEYCLWAQWNLAKQLKFREPTLEILWHLHSRNCIPQTGSIAVKCHNWIILIHSSMILVFTTSWYDKKPYKRTPIHMQLNLSPLPLPTNTKYIRHSNTHTINTAIKIFPSFYFSQTQACMKILKIQILD
jgi:hypothetical protein